ncbi:MAG: DUF1700 domain-containing protein [Erysipelotrichaceae bacterium]
MNRQKFEAILNQKLQVLNMAERQDIIQEYSDHIAMKMESGKSEEEAIADFGDLDVLCNEILDSYHVNVSYTQEHSFQKYLEKIGAYINMVANKLAAMDSQSIGNLVLQFIVVLLCVGLSSMVIHFVINVFADSFRFLPNALFLFFETGLRLMGSLFGFVVGIFLIYLFVQRKIVDAPVPSTQSRNATMSETVEPKPNRETMRDYNAIYVPKVQRSSDSLEEGLLWVLRILGAFLLLPLWVTSFGLIVAAGVCIGLTFQEMMLLGPTLIVTGIMIIAVSISATLTSFLLRPMKTGGVTHEKVTR